MPSFKALVNFARSERAYYGAVINGEVVESRKTYYEDSLQYHAQVDKDTRAITTVFLKCPKLKAKGNHNLEENTGDENCDTVMAFRVIDGGLYQNSIITNERPDRKHHAQSQRALRVHSGRRLRMQRHYQDRGEDRV